MLVNHDTLPGGYLPIRVTKTTHPVKAEESQITEKCKNAFIPLYYYSLLVFTTQQEYLSISAITNAYLCKRIHIAM